MTMADRKRTCYTCGGDSSAEVCIARDNGYNERQTILAFLDMQPDIEAFTDKNTANMYDLICQEPRRVYDYDRKGGEND